MQVDGISHDLCTKIKSMDMDTGLRALERTEEMNAKYLTYWHSGYPKLLKVIYDAPVCLFCYVKNSKIALYRHSRNPLAICVRQLYLTGIL